MTERERESQRKFSVKVGQEDLLRSKFHILFPSSCRASKGMKIIEQKFP